MKFITIIALAVMLASTYGLYGSTSKVVKLTKANFDKEVMQSKDPWIIEFYAPWCGHCKSMAPHFEKAAAALEGIVKIGAVDMTTDDSVGKNYGIQGFPTIKLFGGNKRKPEDYKGARETNPFIDAGLQLARTVAYARIGANPGAQQQQQQQQKGGDDAHVDHGDAVNLTSSNFKIKDNGEWFVMFYAPWCPHCKTAIPDWKKAATNLKGQVNYGLVDCTKEQSLCGQYDVKGYPTFKYFNNAGVASDYEGNRDLLGFTNFGRSKIGQDSVSDASRKVLPLAQLTEQKMFTEYCVTEKSAICILAFLPHIYDVSAEERKAQLDMIQDVTKKTSGKPFNYLWSQGGDQFDFEEMMNLGMGYPTVVAIVAGKKKFSVMRRAWSKENLENYVNGLAMNKEYFYDMRELPTKLKTVTKYVPSAAGSDL